MREDIFKIITSLPEKDLQHQLLEQSTMLNYDKNDVIVREGQYVKTLPIVLEGSIRVFQTKEDREILLYYVEPGQTCMMSLSAGFFNQASAIKAVAASTCTILSVPTRCIAPWQRRFDSWNSFVLKTFRKRYGELLTVFESVAFDHIDKRILDYLRHRAKKTNTRQIQISHQMLADELGTTRVVISRILKQFETDGTLILGRGTIELK
ncbi:Crp/Fnr family transcriptional regulator [Flagellimonas flava]|nr:Crp/Fnr family transcriptional regulator [Allomuricauda flava]